MFRKQNKTNAERETGTLKMSAAPKTKEATSNLP
jgi:hypothetical protein